MNFFHKFTSFFYILSIYIVILHQYLKHNIMEIRVGDIVRSLTDKLEGKVCGFINNNTVNVYSDEYGFEIPVAISDLVVVKSDFKKEEKNEVSSQKQIDTSSHNSVFIAICPDNINNISHSTFSIYIINDTDRNCLFAVYTKRDDIYKCLEEGISEPYSSKFIERFSIRDFDSIESIYTQALIAKKGMKSIRPAIENEVKIKTSSLCKSGAYTHTKWFQTPSLLRDIISSDVDISVLEVKNIEPKKSDIPKGEKQFETQTTNPNIIEVDLHINMLLDDTKGMENKDMLEYQMDVFRKTMEENKLKRGKKIIFIHGKGDGILKQRILWELKAKYKRHNHQDASFKNYGYGATMVTIK